MGGTVSETGGGTPPPDSPPPLPPPPPASRASPNPPTPRPTQSIGELPPPAWAPEPVSVFARTRPLCVVVGGGRCHLPTRDCSLRNRRLRRERRAGKRSCAATDIRRRIEGHVGGGKEAVEHQHLGAAHLHDQILTLTFSYQRLWRLVVRAVDQRERGVGCGGHALRRRLERHPLDPAIREPPDQNEALLFGWAIHRATRGYKNLSSDSRCQPRPMRSCPSFVPSLLGRYVEKVWIV